MYGDIKYTENRKVGNTYLQNNNRYISNPELIKIM